MSFKSFLKRVFTWWDGQTFGTQLWTWRQGVKVGEDAQGNIFYRNADNSRRWVIYKGDIEASRIEPDWHGWLHHTWDCPPTLKPLVHKTWESEHQENQTGTHQAYAPTGSLRNKHSSQARTDYDAWSPE